MALDRKLAQQYGSYASYHSDVGPAVIDTYRDGPADEVDRLLDQLVRADHTVLDLGCGAGQTLCRIAPQVKEIWGFEQDANLLEAAYLRVTTMGLTNGTLVSGNIANEKDVMKLPNDTFDLVLSRRGPNVNAELMPKLKPQAYVIQELYQDPLGLKEIFGRKPFLPEVGADPHWLVRTYRALDLLPVSAKDYFYESFFHDGEHLANYLNQEAMLWTWSMPRAPYDEMRDQTALELYVRYNTTPRGVRLLSQRKVYLFRRAEIDHYPARPEAKPLYPQ